MNHELHGSRQFLNLFFCKPLSSLTAVLAGLMIGVPLWQWSIGIVYFEPLNYVDGTTLIMAGILLLRGIVSRGTDTDLQAVSIALIGALSFVFTYEAIFKLSFYTVPWRMPPAELREFVIQVGIAFTALVGFAFDRFRLSTLSLVFTGIFVTSWVFWLLVGFPQLTDGKNFYPAILNVSFTWDMTYALNRATKFVLCVVYYFFYGDPWSVIPTLQPVTYHTGS